MYVEFETPDQLVSHYKAVRARISRPVVKPKPEPVQSRKRIVWDERICYPYPIGPVQPASPQTVPATDDNDFIPPTITGHEIMRQVARKHRVPLNEILSPRRHVTLCRIRFEIFYRMKTETFLSFPQMGRLVGGRDHTTAMYGAQRFAEMLAKGEVTL